LRTQREIFRKVVGESRAHVADLSTQLPALEAHFYLQNIGQLSLLGPSTARDVVDIYTTLLTRPNGSTDSLTGEQIAMIFEGWAMVYETWLSEQDFVVNRLLAIVADRPDPGDLVDFRSRKSTAQDG
jgi:hypothetical protein